MKTGPLAVGCLCGNQSVGRGCHNRVFPGTAVGCRASPTALSPGRTASPGKRSPGSRFKRSSARKPYQTTPCRPRRSRPTAHPRPPFGGLDPGVPDGGRPTARGASEARAGQPRLLCGERVHGGWRWRTTGPRRVAGAGTAAGQRQGGARARRGGGAGARGHVGAGRERARRGRQRARGRALDRAASGLYRFGVPRFQGNTPPDPKVSQRRGDSVGDRSHTRGRARGGDSRQLRPPSPRRCWGTSGLYLAFHPCVSWTASCLSTVACFSTVAHPPLKYSAP